MSEGNIKMYILDYVPVAIKLQMMMKPYSADAKLYKYGNMLNALDNL